jgi:hypothetical protein
MIRSPLVLAPARSAPALLALSLLTLAPAPGGAQGVPVKTFTRPLAEFAEPYSALRGVRELADGRVVVTDTRDKVVQVVDFRAGRATTLGREGSGPNEYQMPSNALALPGDSTLVADPLNSRFLVLGPGGSLAGTWVPTAGPASQGASGGRASTGAVAGPPPAGGVAPSGAAPRGGATFTIGGAGGPLQLLSTRAVDAAGRVYVAGPPIAMSPEGPRPADSIPILRADRRTMRGDTVAWLQVPRGNTSVNATGGNMRIRIGGGPFAAEDGWTVLPDGRVVVVRYTDYHVEVYPAGGRGAPVRGPAVGGTPIRVTEAEKRAWREERAAAPAVGFAVTRVEGAGGVTQRTAPAAVAADEPESWPATMPLFVGQQVFATPTGEIWVGRSRPASDRSPRFDVFDATGRRTGQVVFPPRTRLLGFGTGVVYTARADEDDLQYLQKWAR